MAQARGKLPTNFKVLLLLLLLLSSILGYRTYKYFGQLSVQTTSATLKKGHGIE